MPPNNSCLICKKNDEEEFMIVPCDDGLLDRNKEGKIVHIGCLALWYHPTAQLLYQKVPKYDPKLVDEIWEIAERQKRERNETAH